MQSDGTDLINVEKDLGTKESLLDGSHRLRRRLVGFYSAVDRLKF